MYTRFLLSVSLVLVTAVSAFSGPPRLLSIFASKAKPISADALKLNEEDGPWLILAKTFVGNNAKQLAERLANEIRIEHDLPAFIYREKFDFTGNTGTTSVQGKRARYANQYRYEAYAVLVGEYDSVENESLKQNLEMLRHAQPKTLKDPRAASESDLSTSATIVNAIRDRISHEKRKGPMAGAFVTRNPMLPESFFQAPEVDSFVNEINSDQEFSLLKSDGKYTVVVRTFEGMETVVDGRNDRKFLPNLRRLNRFAADADRMTKQLRADGIEAYQYHDRFKSIVTVGSFDLLGRELPDGRFEYTPEIRQVMAKFSAFNNRVARAIPGGQGIAANHVAMIPFDVKPTPIAVPKYSKRSLYSSTIGR